MNQYLRNDVEWIGFIVPYFLPTNLRTSNLCALNQQFQVIQLTASIAAIKPHADDYSINSQCITFG